MIGNTKTWKNWALPIIQENNVCLTWFAKSVKSTYL